MQEFVRNSCVFDKERSRQAGIGIVLWHFSFPSIFTVARCSDIFPCCPDSFRILLSSPRPPLPGLAGSSTTVVPAKPCHYSSPPREYIYLTHFIIISLIEMKGINKNLQKLHFPDSIEPMQKVLENSCQSCKKVTVFWKNIRPGQFDPNVYWLWCPWWSLNCLNWHQFWNCASVGNWKLESSRDY